MTFEEKLADPTDLDGLREALRAADPEGRLAPLGMGRIEIGPDASGFLPEAVLELVGDEGGRVVLVTDATPIRRGSEDLKEMAGRLLREAGFTVERAVVGAGHDELHADEEAIAEAEAAVAGADCVVVVGSGTISDVCKVATAQTGGTPLVVVQTAASVNGYSDDVSVLLKSGVKRTVPSRWPDVLLADLPTLAEAPHAMNAAGYGDAIAMYTGPADWYLASLVGMDDSYHPAPIEMVLGYGPDLVESAGAVRRHEPEALEKLVRALTLGGIAAGVTGTTACLSGTEHLVSHLLDMNAGQKGLPFAFHGAQVGVAMLPVAAAWEVLLAEFDPSTVDVGACFPEPEAMEPVVREAFAGIDPTGAMSDECWGDYNKKLVRWRENRETFEAFLNDWPRHRAELKEMVAPPEKLAGALTGAGAPARFGELDPPASPEVVRWALGNCHLMRNRFTVADLLFFLGWWDDAFVERLLDRARSAGGGL
ncbi:iron-containing alcohol dehydrogenase [Rubrobacter marinus]|uniref:Iron-containing alcohol dehydrogenase n=1 Tax=Rubrobacter marinus TaxID=2653852 RepID=A0A6G8Q1B7_9ACTN|nr:iron-containing alcohol dehydrogenase [Rubrobacter marinus]QIN80107.1 iron-containing alcohol dehydrogenase [Rubrobacter marinus]